MTSNDEWTRERARTLSHHPRVQADIRTALQEAIDRGKAERDKAVAAEREMLGNWQQAAELWMGKCLAAEAKLARLDNPDEALVDVATATMFTHFEARETKLKMKETIRALARTLTGQEGESNDDR